MTVLAYGAKEVRALEAALGGKPPRQAAARALAELQRHVRERYERSKAHRTALNPLLAKAQAPLVRMIKADPTAAQSVKKLRASLLARGKPKASRKLLRVKVEPRMVTGSGFWLKAPPYDLSFQSAAGHATASADANAGTYTFGLFGGGSSAQASAGVGMSFLSMADDPQQRIAVLLDYDYHWRDLSVGGYTAHNNGATNIWVWGQSEDTWVLQQGELAPSWHDGTGWWETHGSGGDGSEQLGRASLEAFFPAAANSWYTVWIWSHGACDDSTGSLFGFSYAEQTQNMLAQFVVFGSL
jgi:hypothetical protein